GKVGAAASFEIPNLLNLGSTPVHLSGVHAELDDFGLPIGQALGGGSSNSNPVVASMLRSNGDTTGHAASSSADSQSVAPSLDISIDYDVDHSSLQIHFNGKQHPIWIGINRSFGPIFLQQIGIDLTGLDSGASLTLLVDGGLKVASFDAEVYDLSV